MEAKLQGAHLFGDSKNRISLTYPLSRLKCVLQGPGQNAHWTNWVIGRPSLNINRWHKFLLFFPQVVLNWLIAQENVVPIPGAKNAEQAKEFAGALGWRLTDDEITDLRSLATKINPVIGFPAEKL